MAGSAARVGGAAAGSIAGAEAFQAFLRGYPQAVISDTKAVLEHTADRLVVTIKDAVPVDTLGEHPDSLRNSVRKENGRHDLSVVVIEDGKDTKGRPFAAHVEQGHKTPEGGHVPAKPHFWPAVRDAKRQAVAEIKSGMRRAAKAAPP